MNMCPIHLYGYLIINWFTHLNSLCKFYAIEYLYVWDNGYAERDWLY